MPLIEQDDVERLYEICEAVHICRLLDPLGLVVLIGAEELLTQVIRNIAQNPENACSTPRSIQSAPKTL